RQGTGPLHTSRPARPTGRPLRGAGSRLTWYRDRRAAARRRSRHGGDGHFQGRAMPGQHTKTIEELEAELRACREQITELTRAPPGQGELPPPHRRAPGAPGGEDPPASVRPEALQLHTFKTLADHAIDGVTIADLDRKVYYANAAYRAMTGFGDRAI